MDNSTTTWIMVALLLLLIAAAIYMLLRRPGGEGTAVDNRDVTGVDAPGAAGNTGTDVVAEGRDLGPGTTAPEVDSLRGRADEPFDQHAETEAPRYDEVEADRVVDADDAPVTDDAPVADEDQGVWREAAAVGAAGAVGAGAVAATQDEEPVADEGAAQETDYIVREDDHEPAPAAEVEPVEEPYAAPGTQESVYDAPADDAAYDPATGDVFGTPVDEPAAGTAYDAPSAEETAYTPATGDTVGTPMDEPVADEPTAGTAYASPVEEDSAYATPVEEDSAYATPVEEDSAYATPVEEDSAYATPVEEDSAYATPVEADDFSDTDRQGWRDAAAIGAAGAAGAAVAGAATSATDDTVDARAEESRPAEPVTDEPVTDEPVMEAVTAEQVTDEPAADTTWDDTFVTEPAESEPVGADDVSAGTADVHPLSTEEIDAGAREEPLPAEEQTPLAPEDVSGAGAAAGDAVVADDFSDTDRQGWRDAAAIGATGAAGVGAAAAVSQDERRADEPAAEAPVEEQVGQEYAVGEPTTYGTDGGDAVAVDEQPRDEAVGYHDDTTVVGDGEPVGTTTDEAPTTDYEAGTEVGGATFEGGATPASYEQGDLLEQHETDGGIEERGAGADYADPGVHAPVVEDTTGRADQGDTTVTGDTVADEPVAAATVVDDETVADQTGDDAAAAGGAVFAESAYGPGSAEPGEDGTGPVGWEIKGNSGSMLFHTPESPSYDAVRAEVWFESEETARAAGFAHWDRRRR